MSWQMLYVIYRSNRLSVYTCTQTHTTRLSKCILPLQEGRPFFFFKVTSHLKYASLEIGQE